MSQAPEVSSPQKCESTFLLAPPSNHVDEMRNFSLRRTFISMAQDKSSQGVQK